MSKINLVLYKNIQVQDEIGYLVADEKDQRYVINNSGIITFLNGADRDVVF